MTASENKDGEEKEAFVGKNSAIHNLAAALHDNHEIVDMEIDANTRFFLSMALTNSHSFFQ